MKANVNSLDYLSRAEILLNNIDREVFSLEFLSEREEDATKRLIAQAFEATVALALKYAEKDTENLKFERDTYARAAAAWMQDCDKLKEKYETKIAVLSGISK